MFWFVVVGIISVFSMCIGLQMAYGSSKPPIQADGTPYSAEITASVDKGMKSFGKKLVLVSVVILIATWCWYKYSYSSSQNIESRKIADIEKKCTDKSMAYVMSQNFAKRNLKSPSSASFPAGIDQYSSAIGECKFLIESYVDSQNSFGATIRTNYSAVMEYLPDENKWRLIKLDM